MKTILPLLFISIISCFSSKAQGTDDSECARLQYILSKSNPIENYSEALTLLMHAEEVCDDIGKDNYDRMLVCIQYLMATFEEGSDEYYQYMDTLMYYWEKTEEIDYYNESDDVIRGYYYTLLKEPDFVKADSYLARGIKNKGMELDDEVYIILYYYNIYTLWFMEQDAEKKGELKQRYIKEYFDLTRLIKEANYAPSTQETLTQYLAQVITSCDDLTPEIPAFMESLPEDPESKKMALLHFAELLEANHCVKTDGYKTIVETLYELEPNNPRLIENGDQVSTPTEKIAVYAKLLEDTTDEVEKNRYRYRISVEYLISGSYNMAYQMAGKVLGDLRSKALVIQANAVAASANTCGETTFERKCNYLYAIQLLEQAQELGVENLSSSIELFRSASPYGSQDCCFGKLHKVVLNCWGVTVEYYE